jgi:hypothetical protein
VTRTRRVVAAICLAAIFLAAIVPVASDLFCGVLVPLAPLFGTITASDAPPPESISPQPFPPRSPLPTRGPPA